MRLASRIAVLGTLTAVPLACTSDLPAPDLYATSAPTSVTDSATTGPGALSVECGSPALGAVDANYSHTPNVSGGMGPYIWTAAGLDPLFIDGASGEITGVPTTEGTIMATITVEDLEGAIGSAMCDITINPKLGTDVPAGKPMPCAVGGEIFGDFVEPGTGDGTPITCTVATGEGNGKLPAGVTVNPDTCAIEGSVTENRYGTWVWIVEGDQNGAKSYVPYCATNDQQDANAYTITAYHGGDTMTNKALVPARATFSPGAPLDFGDPMGTMDPRFEVTDASCGNPCFFGFSFFINASPFDGNTFTLAPSGLLKDALMMNLGFFHHLSVSGPAVAANFEDRPWVLNSALDYCISDQNGPCMGAQNVQMNGNANLEFAIVMFPQ